MPYESLLREAVHLGIDIFEKTMPLTTKGLYADNVIWINKDISTSIEKACILAEELGHYHTSTGNILDQRFLLNRKQEKRARNWAYQKLVPLEKIVQAYKDGVKNRYELSEYLNVTEIFLEDAIAYHRDKQGPSVSINEAVIYFSPLRVFFIRKNFYP